MCISPMVLWWIITCFTFLCYSKKNKTSINTKFHRFLRRHHKMTNLANIKTKKNLQTVDNISQVCCPHVELIPYVVKLWKDHKTL